MDKEDETVKKETKLTLGQRLVATGSLGEKLLALGNGLAAEANTLLGVKNGALPDERLDATGTTVDLVQSHLVDDLGAVLPVFQFISASLSGSKGSPIGKVVTDLRRALISSIFSGRSSAKRSFRV